MQTGPRLDTLRRRKAQATLDVGHARVLESLDGRPYQGRTHFGHAAPKNNHVGGEGVGEGGQPGPQPPSRLGQKPASRVVARVGGRLHIGDGDPFRRRPGQDPTEDGSRVLPRHAVRFALESRRGRLGLQAAAATQPDARSHRHQDQPLRSAARPEGVLGQSRVRISNANQAILETQITDLVNNYYHDEVGAISISQS